MPPGQKRVETIRTFLMLALVCGLFFNITYAGQGFRTIEGRLHIKLDHSLMHKLDKPRWTISYRFAEGCSDEFRQREDKFKEMITDILRDYTATDSGPTRLKERLPTTFILCTR